MKSSATIFLSVLLLLLPGCNQEQHTAAPVAPLPRETVQTAPVLRSTVTDEVQVVGTVAARHRVEVASKISGTVTNLTVGLGSQVEPGTLLLEISAGEIDARLRQAEAQLLQARRNLSREKKLLARNAATPETVKEMEEALALAEAGRDEAKIMQGYTLLFSPIPGRVTAKMVDRGDLATPGKPLLIIENESTLQVVADIPEARLLTVKSGQSFGVQVPAADLTTTAVVSEVAPATNPTTRSGQIKLDLTSHPDLRPGQFARVTLFSESAEILTIPAKALLRRGQMELVYVVADDSARLRLVRTGNTIGERVEVLSGLSGDEQVVVDGQHRLQDGQPVTVNQAGPQPTGSHSS